MREQEVGEDASPVQRMGNWVVIKRGDGWGASSFSLWLLVQPAGQLQDLSQNDSNTMGTVRFAENTAEEEMIPPKPLSIVGFKRMTVSECQDVAEMKDV